MTILLGTLCLNEMEHLPNLYKQHKNWPGMVKWVFVESADKVYAEINPDRVSKEGLSVDGTTEFLEKLSKVDDRVIHIKHGISSPFNGQKDQGKCQARQRYLDIASEIKPKFIFVLDADEYYTCDSQGKISWLLNKAIMQYTGFCFRQREIWHPESVKDQPLFSYEVIGGYWKVPHIRGWRYVPRMEYRTNHNWPEIEGILLSRHTQHFPSPKYVHLAFASSVSSRFAKHEYYKARGESQNDKRQMYVDCREAFLTWKPGDKLPYGAKVIKYNGEIPEVFR